jgi:hypothetical protein
MYKLITHININIMDGPTQQLLDYIAGEIQDGVSPVAIKHTLLQNDWSADVIEQAYTALNIETVEPKHAIPLFEPGDQVSASGSFAQDGLTMDKIIEKFIPIVGALFLIIGFGYLIYANAWVNLTMEIRIALGFFFSVVIIGASFSFSKKMNYFADIGIGSGVLLLYGTLIYGSRATELSQAMIPEVVTLCTAAIFTAAIAYFASRRKSRVILILGMIGAYITPFVIGQNLVWVENVSFNAYLIYFFAVNLAIFLIGREISVRDIVPLNIAGLLIGVSTLWGLSRSDDINAVQSANVFSGEMFTAILFSALTIFTIWSLLLSAKRFKEKDDGYLSLGYIAPIIWFAFNINALDSVDIITTGLLYATISISCFAGWHILQGTPTRFQHTAIYAAGLIAAALSVFSLFEEFNVFTSLAITYSSLVFAVLYLIDSGKSERFTSFMLISAVGSLLSIQHILEADLSFETVFVVIALLPAMGAYFVAKAGPKPEYISFASMYSIAAAIIASMFVLSDLVDVINTTFFLFYLAPICFLSYLLFITKVQPHTMDHDTKSKALQISMAWFGFGAISTFFMLLVSIYPAPTDTFILSSTGMPTDWLMINGIFGTIILFIGLAISRALQLEQVIKRPSFILVIFGFSTLVLTGNYIINALMNDFQVALTQGGPRAIATTLWWAAIGIYMLYVGVKLGKKYHSEKLLGLLLLGITVTKVILYDIATMDMQNKIIVLMMVGGGLLLFSYYIRSKDLIINQNQEE